MGDRANQIKPKNTKTHRKRLGTSVPRLPGGEASEKKVKGRKEAGSDASIKDTEVTARRKCTCFQGDGSASSPSRLQEPRRWPTTPSRAFPRRAAAATATRGSRRPKTAASAPPAGRVRPASRTAPGRGWWKSRDPVASTSEKEASKKVTAAPGPPRVESARTAAFPAGTREESVKT